MGTWVPDMKTNCTSGNDEWWFIPSFQAVNNSWFRNVQYCSVSFSMLFHSIYTCRHQRQVKTTAPKSYLVRPSAATLGPDTQLFVPSGLHSPQSGFLVSQFSMRPHSKEEVTIILQCGSSDPWSILCSRLACSKWQYGWEQDLNHKGQFHKVTSRASTKSQGNLYYANGWFLNKLESFGTYRMRASLRSLEHAGQLKVGFQKSMNLYEFAQNHWFMKVWRSGEQCSLAWDVRPLPRSYWGFYMIIRIMIYHVYLHTNLWHVFISKDIECTDIIRFVQRWQHLFSWVAFLQIPKSSWLFTAASAVHVGVVDP